ncbi:hypothetical protein ACSBR1_037726 [Camellia fascicularis]
MTDFAAPGSLAPTGLYLGGTTKYMVIQGEQGAVTRGKKVMQLTSHHITSYFVLHYIRTLFSKYDI